MSEKLIIKYFPEKELAKEPFHATEDAAGYDLFASEAKTILPKTSACISLELKMAVPKGFYGKLFPCSGLFRRQLITYDAVVIDADYRGTVEVLLMNHHPLDFYTVRNGERIGRIFFMKKFDVIFEKLSDPALVGRTKRGSDGFGSTSSSGHKMLVVAAASDQVIVESVSMSVNDKVIIDSDITKVDKIIIDSDLSESNNDDSKRN